MPEKMTEFQDMSYSGCLVQYALVWLADESNLNKRTNQNQHPDVPKTAQLMEPVLNVEMTYALLRFMMLRSNY